MRVQINHNELRPLIKEGYEKVYDAMTRLLAPEEMIFAKWEAGFGGILQWTLPGDIEWRNFTSGDNYDKQAVINEFLRLKEIGEKKLGTNERLKNAVYSIPSEASVYFAVTPDGKYHVMLTAWGYSFPAQAPMTDIAWQLPPESQNATVRFIENGSPIVNIPINIHRNGITTHHQLNDNGEKYLGKLMPGYEMQIEVPSHSRTVTLTVATGQTIYTFDLTNFSQGAASGISETHAAPSIPIVNPKPKPTEPIEEKISIGRTLKVQFIGCDGKPITGRNVEIKASGVNLNSTTTDESGLIYLPADGIINGSKLEAEITDAAGQVKYSKADFIVEDNEDDYAIIYSERKDISWWAYLLMLLAVAALTYIIIRIVLESNLY